MKDKFGTQLKEGDVVAFTNVGKAWSTNYPALLCVVIGFTPKKIRIKTLHPWNWRRIDFGKIKAFSRHIVLLSEEQISSLTEIIVVERNRDIGNIQRTDLTLEDIELQTRKGVEELLEISVTLLG